MTTAHAATRTVSGTPARIWHEAWREAFREGGTRATRSGSPRASGPARCLTRGEPWLGRSSSSCSQSAATRARCFRGCSARACAAMGPGGTRAAPATVRRVPPLQGQRTAPPGWRKDHPPRRGQPGRQGPRAEGQEVMGRPDGAHTRPAGRWPGPGRHRRGADRLRRRLGRCQRDRQPLVTIAIVLGSIIGLAALGGIGWFVYRARQDRAGRPIAARPVHQLPPRRDRASRPPDARPSSRVARSTFTSTSRPTSSPRSCGTAPGGMINALST